jgi:hypothetical protein
MAACWPDGGGGIPAVLIEARHVKAALKAMTVKTDQNDARGMAHVMRTGFFRPVHAKGLPAQDVRALLTGRQLLLGAIFRTFAVVWSQVGKISKGKFAACIRTLVTGHPMLEQIAEAMLRAHAREPAGRSRDVSKSGPPPRNAQGHEPIWPRGRERSRANSSLFCGVPDRGARNRRTGPPPGHASNWN